MADPDAETRWTGARDSVRASRRRPVIEPTRHDGGRRRVPGQLPAQVGGDPDLARAGAVNYECGAFRTRDRTVQERLRGREIATLGVDFVLDPAGVSRLIRSGNAGPLGRLRHGIRHVRGSGQAAGAWEAASDVGRRRRTAWRVSRGGRAGDDRSLASSSKSWGSGSSSSGSRPGISGPSDRCRFADLLRFAARTRGFRLRGSSRRARRRPRLRGGGARLGAVAAIVERPISGLAVPQIVVDAARPPGRGCGWWYGDPSHELGIVGITGTDGKTTPRSLQRPCWSLQASRRVC